MNFSEFNNPKIKKLIAIYAVILCASLLVVLIVHTASNNRSEKIETIFAGYNENLTSEQLRDLIFEEQEKEQTVEQRYESVIAQIAIDNPNKEISLQDENDIQRNLPKGVTYYELKNRLIEKGFEFIGFESSIILPNSSSNSAEIKNIVDDLKIKYPDKKIGWAEEQEIRKNLPSYIYFTSVKDEMLKQGFEF